MASEHTLDGAGNLLVRVCNIAASNIFLNRVRIV